MIDTDAIRGAFAALADEAPPPDRIRASLSVRARRHRRRRLVLRLAGAGAVAATTGVAAAGAWRATRPTEPGFPLLAGGPGGGWLEVALRFRPTWLPHRYGEGRRTVVVDDRWPAVLSRDWQPGAADRSISLLIGWHPSLEADRPRGRQTTVDVNGVPGQLVQVDGHTLGTYLTWQPPGGGQLMVSVLTGDGAADQRDVAVRVARSVRADRGITWVGPRFGWLPRDLATVPWRLHQGFAGTDWTQDAVVTGAGGRQLLVSMGTNPARRLDNTFPTTPVHIRQWSGWQVPQTRQLFLIMGDGVEAFAQLDDGAGGEQAMSDLIMIMEGFEFGPWPDMSWIGGR
jgi:hypothetical protein